MKPTYYSCLYYLLVSFCLVSCNPGIYVPASQNVPLFQQKGEARVMIGQTTVQSALAVGPHISVAMNAQYINESSRKFMTPRGWPNTKQARLELAGGYFTHKKTSRSPILECYAGGGYGLATYAVRNVWIKQPAIPYTLYDLTIPSQN